MNLHSFISITSHQHTNVQRVFTPISIPFVADNLTHSASSCIIGSTQNSEKTPFRNIDPGPLFHLVHSAAQVFVHCTNVEFTIIGILKQRITYIYYTYQYLFLINNKI